MEFTIYRHVRDTLGDETKTLREIATYIRATPGLRARTEEIRELLFTDLQGYKHARAYDLIQFSPAGTFERSNRSKSGLIHHSGLILVDFDNLSASRLRRVKEKVKELSYTALMFVSPSGEGLKVFAAINPLPTDQPTHINAYEQVVETYKKVFEKEIDIEIGADEQGKNLSKLCALCYDGDVYFNPDPEPLKIGKPKPRPEKKKKETNLEPDLTALNFISPDAGYQTWLKVGMAIKAEGLDISVWLNWSSKSKFYDEAECQYKWGTFTEEGVAWGTVVHIAKDNGYETPRSNKTEPEPEPEPEPDYPDPDPEPEQPDVKPKPKDKNVIRERKEIELQPDKGIVRTANEIWAEIEEVQREDPTIFRRGYDLVGVVRDVDGNMRFEEIDNIWIKKYLDRHIVFKAVRKTTTTIETKTVDDLPKKYADTLLSREGGYPDWIPKIRAIAPFPMLGLNDKIVTKRGYDPNTEFYLSHDTDVDWKNLPYEEHDVEDAIRLLSDIVRDFPFEDEESLANWLGYLLSFPLRSYISRQNGVYPLYAVTAPVARSGKTKLVNIASIIWTGRPADITQVGQDNRNETEEMRKRLLATLAGGHIVQVFDNVDITVSSGNLASAITSGVYKDRVLGKTEMLSVAVEWILAFTGNQLSFGGDMPLRVYWTRLQAAGEKPENRTGFKYKNLEQHCLYSRFKLMRACLIILKSWIMADKPVADDIKFGGFEVWSSTIGGVLRNAKVESFLSDREHDDSPELLILREFVDAWFSSFGTTKVTAKDLFPIASYRDNYGEASTDLNILEDYIYGRTEDSRAKSFGRYLTKQLGRIFGGYKINKHTKRINNTTVYYLSEE